MGDYEEALQALGNLISRKQRGDGRNWQAAFRTMRRSLQVLDLLRDLPKLKVIHVAGTKGKGSTCAMVESMLRCAGYRTGLFTSPHLCDVRERIRIGGQMVSQGTFLKHFWWCYQRLEAEADHDSGMPAYFRFLTLLGLKIFVEEVVDVVILEVGLGGRLDATNCIQQPVVCGITSLGFDHMDLLGHTLPEIAREKAGIIKPSVPILTVSQPPDALQAMQDVAAQVGQTLEIVPPLASYQRLDLQPIQLGLAGAHQQVNAALAVSLAATWEARVNAGAAAGPQPQDTGDGAELLNYELVRLGQLPSAYAEGLQSCYWPGRGQVVHDLEADPAGQRLAFYLDGAHTPESMITCSHWFANAVKEESASQNGRFEAGDTQRVLLFNCMMPVAEVLQQRDALPHHTIFTQSDSSFTTLGQRPKGLQSDMAWQRTLLNVWQLAVARTETAKTNNSCTLSVAKDEAQLPPVAAKQPLSNGVHAAPHTAVVDSLSETLGWLRQCVKEHPCVRMQVLVTGSLYLVGDVLRLLGKAPR